MGGTAASLLTNTTMTPNGTTLGATGGAQTVTLTSATMPVHTHSTTDSGHTHGVANALLSPFGGTLWSAVVTAGGDANLFWNSVTASSNAGTSVQNAGSGGAHVNVQPTMIFNVIIKL
jgi:microcystin-dependent protein